MQETKPFSLLIKPSSADCNLRCEYCFYLDKSELYSHKKRHRMSHEVLEKMISGYLSTEQPVYSFGWQGGEPTLMGLSFFEAIVSLQSKYGKGGKRVANGLQTNATLITEEMAKLFKEYHFLLGVSIDGPKQFHDTYRKNISGAGSHSQVLKGIELLQKNDVEFNALILVNKANVGEPEIVYNYVKGLGILHHQYIPCVEFDEQGQLAPFSITGKEWGTFLTKIFNLWWESDAYTVSVRHFDAIIRQLALQELSMCTQWGNCCQYFVVEYNGDVYPCDFFVEERKKVGNIFTDSWKDLQQSKKYINFGKRKADWNTACYSCPYLYYCSGDCLKHRIRTGHSHTSLSVLCEGWKFFYDQTLERLKKISLAVINRERELQSGGKLPPLSHLPLPKIGYNSLCFCGSNKKYKDCHGKKSPRS